MHDRNIDIVYEIAKNENQFEKLNEYSEFDSFRNFAYKWNSMPMSDKMQIALQTDIVNKKGADAFNEGNIESAIEYFNKALQIMPINDDALINLARCYTKVGQYDKSIEPLKMLDFLSSTSTKSKIIAYSLLMHLIMDFDSDGGTVGASTMIKFVEQKFEFKTNDDEIKSIIHRINEPYNRDIVAYFIGGGFGLGSGESPYMTSDGTTKSVIIKEISDVLNWD